MKPRCPSIELTRHGSDFFASNINTYNICTNFMFEYEIHIFELRIETNSSCMTLEFEVISASSVVARKV